MHHLNWFFHMDNHWMWRWFLTDEHGNPLAISNMAFFRFEDAEDNLKAARMALRDM